MVDDNRLIHADFRKILQPEETRSHADLLEAQLFGEEPPASVTELVYELDAASQGEEALRRVAAACAEGRPYAVAFVDMRMPPGWNGVETIEQLWAVDPELQVVLCTAYSDFSWEEILARLGLSDRLLLLKKPFDTAEVAQLACALTEKWHLARQAQLKLSELGGMVSERTKDLADANVRLKESEARYALAAEGANDGLWDLDYPGGRIYYSPRFCGMLGEDALAETADAWLARIHPEDRALVASRLLAPVDPHLSIEYRILHRDGQYRWMLCRGIVVRDEAGAVVRAAGSQTDITDRKLAEAQLWHDAFHDGLTGLPNRALLAERLDRAMARKTSDPGYELTLMFLDVDHFKVVNDGLGHLVGDALLVELAHRLGAAARAEGAELARVGGDEFVLLFEGPLCAASTLADRLQAAVAPPFVIGGREIHSGISVGLAVARGGDQTSTELLRDADTALYRAKAAGRSRSCVFSAEMHTAAVARWRMENDLRRAIDEGQLTVFYQPIVSLQENVIEHFEALVRWRHPERGLVSPLEFIPLAEETGLIVPLGSWVLREVCRQVGVWRKTIAGIEAVSVAVNVAGPQFMRDGFVEEVRASLEAFDLPPSAIALEVTESSMMSDAAIARCAQLRALGVKLYLDDFGTGYSSLSYLHRMPLDALKIDRSFTSTMLENPMSASIVASIVALAQALDLVVVAEGVERASELALLNEMGCEKGQGYFWSKPLPSDMAGALLRGLREEAAA